MISMKQYKYDKLLGIKTGEDKFLALPPSLHYNPYEPTSYEALEALIEHYPIPETDVLVDFGCGKGRMNFFLHHFTGATVKGVEMNDDYIEDAIINQERYYKKHPRAAENMEFIACLAEEYRVTEEDNCFYFFNPFSAEIFIKVVNNILHSYEAYPRAIDILLFYPHKDYIYYLEKNTAFELHKEIKIGGFFGTNNNERILIYRYPFS